MAKHEEKAEEVVEAPVEESSSVKERKAAYQKLIDTYAKQNPVKYESKKAELQKKLDAIK